MPNGLPIDIETFEELPLDKQNVAIYKVLVHMVGEGFEPEQDRQERLKSCELRFQALEKKKWTDRTFSGSMGLIGGFLASLFKVGSP